MNILIIFGTRPEAIKMVPIIIQCKNNNIPCDVCITGQHKIVEQMLDRFSIEYQYNLKIMKENQTINYVFYETIKKLDQEIKKKYDYVLVHGDTTSAAAASVWAFNNKINIAHIEAGLRSKNLYDPFPEEMNRQIIDRISTLHFCPLNENKKNLLDENINEKNIYVVGNTIIDSILNVVDLDKIKSKKQVLITCHRRENFDNMNIIFEAILELSKICKNYHFVFPMHPNKNIQRKAIKILGNVKNISLINHLEYFEFIKKLSESEIIITDSGGVLEEASFLGKKVLVIRNTLERRELLSKNVIVSCVENRSIISNFKTLMNYKAETTRNYKMGDGNSSKRILEILQDNKKW